MLFCIRPILVTTCVVWRMKFCSIIYAKKTDYTGIKLEVVRENFDFIFGYVFPQSDEVTKTRRLCFWGGFRSNGLVVVPSNCTPYIWVSN